AWYSADEPSYPTTNYSVIEDGLSMGGMLAEPPPGTRAVLNVCESKDPYWAEVHRWQPIRDAARLGFRFWFRPRSSNNHPETVVAGADVGRPAVAVGSAAVAATVAPGAPTQHTMCPALRTLRIFLRFLAVGAVPV